MTSFSSKLATCYLALLATLLMAACGRSHGHGDPVVVESGLVRMCQISSGIPRVTLTIPVDETCLIARGALLESEEEVHVVQGLEWRTSGVTVTEVGAVRLACDDWWRNSLEAGAIEVPAPSDDLAFAGVLTANVVESGGFVTVSGEFEIRIGSESRTVQVSENRLWTGHGCF